MLLGEWIETNSEFIDNIITPDIEIVPNELLDFILRNEYGERILHEPMINLSGVEVAKFINMRYNSKWIKVSEYLENTYDIGTVNSKDISEDFDGTISGTQSGDVVNKESAFNTDDFVNSGKQENSLENESVNINSRTRTEKYKSYFTANQQVMNMNNEQLSNVIIKDIVNELCLKIY